MKRVEGIDEAFFVPNSDAVLSNEKKLRVGNDKLLAVSRANSKGPKPAAQPFFQFLHVHIWNVNQPLNLVKRPPWRGCDWKWRLFTSGAHWSEGPPPSGVFKPSSRPYPMLTGFFEVQPVRQPVQSRP